MTENQSDQFSGAHFQKYAHDEYLGGDGGKLRGLSRDERDFMFGERDTKRTLKCSFKLREIFLRSKNE